MGDSYFHLNWWAWKMFNHFCDIIFYSHFSLSFTFSIQIKSKEIKHFLPSTIFITLLYPLHSECPWSSLPLCQLKKYLTGRWRHGRPHKLFIFLISINSRIDIVMSVFLSVRLFKNLHPQDYDSYSCQVWYSYVFLLHVDRVSFRFSPRPFTPSLIDKTVLKALF